MSPATPRSLAALCGLGLLSALWSVVLWAELRAVRAGAEAFCAIGASDCARVWDAPFASAVHAATGLPIAGWGLAWSLAATALALAALLRRAEGADPALLVTTLRLMALGGAVAVVVLMSAAALDRAFCAGCAVTYLLVAGFAGIALAGWPGAGWPQLPRAAGLAAAAVIGGWLLLLYPGKHTPSRMAEQGRAALAHAATSAPAAGDDRIAQMIASLEPPLQQALADSLAIYAAAPQKPEPAPRALLVGSADAPVRITEFTDIRCEHCADLHRTIAELQQYLGEETFGVVSRQFPLDAGCNPQVPPPGKDPVRCLAARAQICAEGQPGARAFAGAMFEAQARLTVDDVRKLAAQHVPAVKLDACVASAATDAKLGEDIALAMEHGLEGTPLVLVNGRRGTSFGPFLYAMIANGGSTEHPSFARLPAPDPRAHMH